MMTPSTPFTPMMPFAPARPTLNAQTTSRLVTELAPRVLAVTRAVLGRGHSDVDDAYQQGILELIRALPSFRGDCEPIHPGGYHEARHFASRIAARTALTIARRSRTAFSRRDDGADVDRIPVETHTEEDVEQKRRMGLLRDLLARIPEEQAETLTLRVMLGWSLPDVAAATGVPLNTVRSRVRLAKNALRAAVEADPLLIEELDRRRR
jgi:RNA polymerase sigma factor (sigma-70 family)